MKKKLLPLALIIACIASTTNNLSAQQIDDSIAKECAKHLERQYISDGQQYRALLMNDDETAEFHTTLYGGTVYRIAACSGFSDGNLSFAIYDSERNILFNSADHKDAPFWDFKIMNTIDCLIEAKLSGRGQGSGRAVILIGFKPQK